MENIHILEEIDESDQRCIIVGVFAKYPTLETLSSVRHLLHIDNDEDICTLLDKGSVTITNPWVTYVIYKKEVIK